MTETNNLQASSLIRSLGKNIIIPSGTTVFQQGDLCHNYLVVTKGVVKVFTRSEHGREILLYRVGEGESCTLTTTCLLAENSYPAEGVTESLVEALVISAAEFKLQLNQCALFRTFIFSSYSQRLCDVISRVEEISFGRLDARLAHWLVDAHQRAAPVSVTHQQIATDLGTAREVVSRKLKELEVRGWLKLSRGTIDIICLDKLIAFQYKE